MKRMLPTTQYYFNSGGNQLDFSMYADFDPKRVLAIINTTIGQTVIFATGGGPTSPTGGYYTGIPGLYQLYLTFNCSAAGMNDTDILQIIYDESVGTEEAQASTDIITGRAGLDCNLLNSSFGGSLDDVLPIGQDLALSLGVLNGGVLSAPSMNVNNELIIDCTQSGNVPVAVSNTVSISGNVTVDNFPASQAVTGAFYPATQPVSGSVSVSNFPATQAVSAVSLPLPSGASTSALQTLGNSVLSSIDSKATSIDNKIPTQGQKVSSGSLPVVLSSDQSTINTILPDLFVTGQATQTATINNILTTTAGVSASDAASYKSASIQVVSSGTAGTFIFEGSNDNSNFQAIPVFNQALLNGGAVLTAITATASQIVYVLPVQTRYIRLRIATTITGGSVQAFTRLSQNTFSPATNLISQATAGNLNATVAGALTSVGTITTVTGVTTVSSITSANLAIPAIVSDVASAALTTTTTTATITPSFGISYQINIPVTAVSGTSPTLDVTIEESDDTGSNWYKVYDFPRITGTGIYRSPHIPFFGNRLRYVQVVSGTTPSFTRSINRLQSSYPALSARQLIDRTISLITLNSTTPILLTRDCGNATQLVINVGAITTTAPAIQLEGSDDFGTTWYSIGSPLTAVASSTVQVTVNSINAAAIRARVSTAGVGVTAGYVMIKAHD